MKNVVLYARSATSKPHVDQQIQFMEGSLDPGTNVVGRYSDVGSGMDSNRPGLRQAFNCLQNGEAETLVVQSIDRLTRSVQELARLTSLFWIEIPMEPRNLG